MSNEVWEAKNESYDCGNAIVGSSSSSSMEKEIFSPDDENKSIEDCRRSGFIKQFNEIMKAFKSSNPNLCDLNRKFHALKDEAIYLKSDNFFKWRGLFYYETGLVLKEKNDPCYIKLYKKALSDCRMALNFDPHLKEVKDWKMRIEKELREQSLGTCSAILFKNTNGLNANQLATQEKINPKIR